MCWLLISLIILLVFVFLYSSFRESFTAEYLNYKSKSFDSEKQMINMYGEDGAWMANPSRSFDSEYDGVLQANGDISGGFLGKTMRFY